MIKKEKVTIVGSGYVGMSLAVLLARQNEVTILDIDKSRIDKINSKTRKAQKAAARAPKPKAKATPKARLGAEAKPRRWKVCSLHTKPRRSEW